MQEDCHMVRGRQHKSYWPTSEDGNLSQPLLQRKLKLQQNPTLLHQGLYKVSGTTDSRLAEVLDFRGNYGMDISLLQLWGPIAPVKLANQWLPELTGSQADTSILDSLFGTGEAAKRITTKETWIIITLSLSVCCKPTWLTERDNESWDQWVVHSDFRFWDWAWLFSA